MRGAGSVAVLAVAVVAWLAAEARAFEDIHRFAIANNLKAMRELLDEAPNDLDVNAVSDARSGVTPLHLAATRGHHELVALLVKHGARTEVFDDDGFTPLHWAAYKGHLATVVTLLSAGADPSARVLVIGSTPLHKAAVAGHEDVVAVLVSEGSPVDAADNVGATPLHLAAVHGRTNAAYAVLEGGAFVDAVDDAGQTPLHWAVLKGDSSCTRLLLANGAHIHHRNTKGESVADAAVRHGYVAILEAILDHAIQRPGEYSATLEHILPYYVASRARMASRAKRIAEAGVIRFDTLNSITTDDMPRWMSTVDARILVHHAQLACSRWGCDSSDNGELSGIWSIFSGIQSTLVTAFTLAAIAYVVYTALLA